MEKHEENGFFLYKSLENGDKIMWNKLPLARKQKYMWCALVFERNVYFKILNMYSEDKKQKLNV